MSEPKVNPVEMARASSQIELIAMQIQEKIKDYEKSMGSSQDWTGRTRTALVGQVSNRLVPELKKLSVAVSHGASTIKTTSEGFQEHDYAGSTGMEGAEGAGAAPAPAPTPAPTSTLTAPLNEVVV